MFEIRGIVFDLDGVIADSHPLHEQAWTALLVEAGRQISLDDVAATIRSGRTRAEILRIFFPQHTVEEREKLGARKDELLNGNLLEQRPVSGVIEWIHELAVERIPLAVATSASRERAMTTLKQFGIEELFRAVITSLDVPAGKPDPALFQKAAEALRTNAGNTLVVEDAVAGLAAAHAAGMACLFYSANGEPSFANAQNPEFQISAFTPRQLRPVMRLLAAAPECL